GIIGSSMPLVKLHRTVGVKVGHVQVDGGAPIVVQSMTMTDTADARATATQCIELAEAGSEMVRVTVNLPEAATAVAEIKQRMLDAGCLAPLIGDFHYNGHLLLAKFPGCAAALDKYRINPGNVGTGRRRDEQFATICKVAVDHARPVRIGVNGGSLNQELVVAKMQENTDRELGLTSEEIINECRGRSALEAQAERIQDYIRDKMPEWKTRYQGVETMTLAVMGCVVNGPGESKAANIGISLPGTGEAPNCPIYIDGEHVTTLRGTYDELAAE